MAHKRLGKSSRKGISLTKLLKMFPDDDAARKWFEERIWPEGSVEVDEIYIVGKQKSMLKSKRKALTRRGAVGKTTAVGAKDRPTNDVSAGVVRAMDRDTLHGFVRERTAVGATVYTDDAAAYVGMTDMRHEAINHSVGEYVRGMVRTNGVESFWGVLKHGYQGTFHHFSERHTDRYVAEFAGRHNIREADTIDIMASVATGMKEKRFRYRELIADNGLESGAQS